MSSTGLKTIDSDDIYCTSLTVSGINIITSLNNLNITSSNNLNALSTYSNLNIENLKLTSTTIFNNLNALSTYSNLNIENLKLTSTNIFNNLNSFSTNTITLINNKTNFNNLLISGASTFLNILNISGATTINNSLNVVGNITTSGLSVFNINSTVGTIFNNLNSFSNNAQLQINNLFTTKQNNLTVQNPFILSTNSNLSLNYDTTQLGLNASNKLYVLPGTASKWTTNGIVIYYNGKVALGTSINTVMANHSLQVDGNSRIDGNINILDALSVAPSSILTRNLNICGAHDTSIRLWSWNATYNPLIEFIYNSVIPTTATNYTYYWNINIGTTANTFNIRDVVNSADRLVINNAGNVGIGLSNPSAGLHIVKSTTSDNPDSGGQTHLYLYNPTNAANNNCIANIRIAGSSAGKALLSYDVSGVHGWSCYVPANNNSYRINNNWSGLGTDILTCLNNGYVGVGVSPQTKFTIKGDYNSVDSGLCIDANDGTAYNLKLYPYVVSGGVVGYKFRILNQSTTSDVLTLRPGGNVDINTLNAGSSGVIHNMTSYLYINTPNGTTHFPWSGDNQNYIRGNVRMDTGSLYVSGSVGFGAEPSTYRVNIGDGVNTTVTYTGTSYFGATSGFVSNTTAAYNNFAFYCGGSALFGRWVAAVSDERIKKEIEDINDDLALQKLLSIQPKTYKYIDNIRRGEKKVFGFIAQQIREVLPEAIEFNKDFIPNIYKKFNLIEDIITTTEDLTDKLNINDNIKIIKKQNEDKIECKILEISPTHIKIDKNIEGDECFIYGKEVNDFHTLSKEYIFTLNVCATQELYKLIQQQQTIINDLQNRLSILENKNI